MELTFGERIKEARKIQCLTQKQLANLIGAKHNSISDWENNKNRPDPDTIELLCGVLKITPNYLLSSSEDDFSPKEKRIIKKYRFITEHSPEGAATVDTVLNREYSIVEQLKEQKERIEELEAENTPQQRIIAYYQRLASAGSGDYLFDDIPTDFIRVKSTAISRQADFVIGVNGRSMEDTYHDGDRVFVKKLPEIDIGDIGVFTRGNDCFIKELGTDRLISHNQDKDAYPDIPASDDIRLVGKVLGLVAD
jgi:repressor LexA